MSVKGALDAYDNAALSLALFFVDMITNAQQSAVAYQYHYRKVIAEFTQSNFCDSTEKLFHNFNLYHHF